MGYLCFNDAHLINPLKEYPMSTNWQNAPMVPDSFVQHDGAATLGGVNLADVAAHYGTPLYVMDAATLRTACREYHQTLSQQYSAGHLVVLACKSNFNVGLSKLVASEGLGFDVVSAGELYTVMKAGFSGENVVFNGNNKTAEELEMAINFNVNRISLDNFDEIHRLAGIAKTLGKQVNVLARVSPGIECHTHEYIKTGQNDSKFGFPIQRLDELVEAVLAYPEQLCFKGIHGHIGSQIFELQAYKDLVTIFFERMNHVREKYNVVFEDMNLGGGWGISYTHDDSPLPIPTAMQAVADTVKAAAKEFDYPLPRLIFEPGRSIMARAGITMYGVGARKDVEGAMPFITVDGGMGDNIRPALYQAEYEAAVLNKLGQPDDPTPVRVVGKYCESGDIVLRNFTGPKLASGDTLIIFGTGAYNYTMASVYNRFGRPAMVLVEDGKHALLVERESLDDLLVNDRVPSWL